MGIENVLQEIDSEISRLQEARRLLVGGGSSVGNGAPKPKVGRPRKKKRNLSPEGRARIAAAVKARWAREKSTKKK